VCAEQQLPAAGFPQVPAQLGQCDSAAFTQSWSQSDSQHTGSSVQTVMQQVWFEHDGVECTVQQLPLVAWPQPGPQLPHACAAVPAQTLSHDCMQQTGSITQIERQQRSSEQPGVACAAQQLPPAGPPHEPLQGPQRMAAACAHDASHVVSQQKPSSEQIASQQSASEHDGVACAVQQLPVPGFPQPMPQTPQIWRARAAQSASHEVWQQKLSAAQTWLQQPASSHDGPWCVAQHEPVIGLPH
jgi:hypothetical protein